MKFSTTKDVLIKGMQNIQSAINIKSSLPILSNFLIETKEEEIVLTTTDLDIGITTTIPIKAQIQGAITIPAKKFFDIIKELPEDQEIAISVKKNNLIHIECEKNIFKIMGLPKEEFPQLPEIKNKDFIILPQNKLKTILSITSFAVSHDESRYVLNGILFVLRPTAICLVATDGRRLAMCEEKMQLPKTLERKAIIPTKGVNELARLLDDDGDVKMTFGENQVFFDIGATRLVTRLIEGEFPNYEQVIPKEAKEKIIIPKDKFLSAVKRAALFTTQESVAVKLDITRDKIVISKNSPYLGEAEIQLDADYKGKDISVGFNPTYLIDVLKNLTEESVNFEVTDSEKPGCIRSGGEYVYVVLPMQLGA